MVDPRGHGGGRLSGPLALAGLTKDEARREAARHRNQIHGLRPMAGHTLAAWPPTRLISGNGLVVAGYWPVRSEIDPRPLMTRCSRAGVQLALPRLLDGGAPGPLAFHRWSPGEPLVPGPFGLKQPMPDAPRADHDLLLVPLLAFDDAGGRLGYGGGYYDRTLEALRGRKPVFALGLAFAGQGADHVPLSAHDQPLDAVATEEAWRPFAEARPREPFSLACDREGE